MAETSPLEPARRTRPDPTPDEVTSRYHAVVDNVNRVIQGKSEVVELVLLGVLAGGHVLVEDVPGVGKTSLAKALAASIQGSFGRIQFTPDLLPSDVVGVSVYDRRSSTFDFRPGPVFANVVLADEINRASPKTQSALLEAMAEGQVTVGGTTYPLEDPFLVLATQNPAEHEGAYPLPDSQLDRFLLRVSMGYPAAEAEVAVLESDGAVEVLPRLRPVVDAADVAAMAAAARRTHVAPGIRHYLVDLAAASRTDPRLALGMSPRATLSLQRATQARAATRGRDFVVPDDVKALAVPAVAHRLLLAPEAALAGATRSRVVEDLLASVPVPTSAGARR
ncbi:AAA family ATPase [Iamia majanohamensis]|uniref:AAA family ATPase n=1 Tax=Iamia majanohamensis TaxID=467976 RepID=A0AAF0BQS4_9ACTN|nr:AAA family ATPase [Iamia majanohamensis]WCO65241.1 AAA family ATPase [Iamia majanohamensis]